MAKHIPLYLINLALVLLLSAPAAALRQNEAGDVFLTKAEAEALELNFKAMREELEAARREVMRLQRSMKTCETT